MLHIVKVIRIPKNFWEILLPNVVCTIDWGDYRSITLRSVIHIQGLESIAMHIAQELEKVYPNKSIQVWCE